MENKNKEWIAIVVCIITGVVANIQSWGNGSSQKVYHEKVYDTTLHHRSAILDVREKIDYLYRRVSRLEDATRILPPGPRQVPPPSTLDEMDAGSLEPDADVIEEKDSKIEVEVEVQPPPKPNQAPFEMKNDQTPKWEPLQQSLPSY